MCHAHHNKFKNKKNRAGKHALQDHDQFWVRPPSDRDQEDGANAQVGRYFSLKRKVLGSNYFAPVLQP